MAQMKTKVKLYREGHSEIIDVVCNYCGNTKIYAEDSCEIDGNIYCGNCFCYCASCGKPHPVPVGFFIVSGNGEVDPRECSVCEKCYVGGYIKCPSCEQAFHVKHSGVTKDNPIGKVGNYSETREFQCPACEAEISVEL